MKKEMQTVSEKNKPSESENLTVIQNGNKNMFFDAKDNSSLNLSINILSQLRNGRRETLKIDLNMSHYHLIITNNNISEQDCVVVRADCSLVKSTISNDCYEKYANLSDEAIREILKFPAIICNRNTSYGGKTDKNQTAIYAALQKIEKNSTDITIYFYPLSYIPQYKLVNNHKRLGINISCALTDLNIVGWTIKEINLLEACKNTGINILVPST